jgi:hypothetical protein
MKRQKQISVRAGAATLLVLTALGRARAGDYSAAVLQDAPLSYYRFDDSLARSAVQKNSGSLGAAGDATTDLGTVHSIPGAIAGDRAAFFDFASRTEVPWNAAFNPPNTQAFTMEGWFYPTSDQTATGQSPVNNRYAPSGGIRQGWVIFQRKPDTDHEGSEQVGWNFRMYNENGGSSGLDITSLVPYQLGKWTHLAVVYEPNNLVDATLTMYVDGVQANTVAWTGGSDGSTPGYVANSNNHTDDPASLALGNYNNTAGTSLNPYFGGIDEFAIYTNKLSAAQILAHYQNATNANRITSYSSLIKTDNPVVYFRLDELPTAPDQAVNMGDVRAAGVATHGPEVRYPADSALAGRTDDGSAAYHNRNGNSTTTMPFVADNNPDAGVPFTFEVWLRPRRDLQGGQCPVNNRFVKGTGRTGWVIFQRNPNETYPPSEGLGWNFRMYSGVGGGGQDVITGVPYKMNEWSHLVVTWEPQDDMGDPGGNGNHQFSGTLTAYFNGQKTDQQTRLYAANLGTTETGDPASDLAIGSYNAASGLGSNPYEGDVDELAIYANYVLTPDQILSHYTTGTNAHPATNYETLVLNAPFTGPERQGPKTYLRFSEPARYPATNSGTLGYLADGNLVLTTNNAAGPRPPVAGFDASNTALPLDGLKQWASLNNPAGLNIAGQITLEAWIQPGATQGDVARIISHGPPTISDFLGDTPPDDSVTNSAQVFLSIEGGQYVVGSAVFTNGVGTNRYVASAAIPAGDLGGTAWIHLAGTYDGANWKLYRNGTEIASAAASVGAVTVPNGDWAIGSTGNGWAETFAGSIDEVAIYNHALTAAQIQAHANASGGSTGGDIQITSIVPAQNGFTLTWTGGAAPYTIQQRPDFSAGSKWSDLSTTSSTSATVSATGTTGFFRIAH